MRRLSAKILLIISCAIFACGVYMLSDSIVRRYPRSNDTADMIFDRRALIPAVTSISLALLAFVAGTGFLYADGSVMIRRKRQ